MLEASESSGFFSRASISCEVLLGGIFYGIDFGDEAGGDVEKHSEGSHLFRARDLGIDWQWVFNDHLGKLVDPGGRQL